MENLTTMSYGKAANGMGVTRIVIDGSMNDAINFVTSNGKLYQFTNKHAQKDVYLSQATDDASNARPVHISEKDMPAFMKALETLKTTAIKDIPPKPNAQEQMRKNLEIPYIQRTREELAYPLTNQEKYETRLPPLDKALENIIGYRTDAAKELSKTIKQEEKNDHEKQINVRLANLSRYPEVSPAAQLFGTLSEHLSALKTKGITPTSFNAQKDMQQLITQAGLLENPDNKIPAYLTQQSFDPHAGLREAAQHSTQSTTTQSIHK